MQEPKTTNRERLLRLIDGGHEALKEFQKETSPQITPVPGPKKTDAAPGPKTAPWTPADVTLIAKWALALAAIVALLHYGSKILESREPSSSPAAAGTVASEDGPGTGLRLVGVDSSTPPVALLEDLQTGKTHFARVNDRVNGVRVKQIEKNRVTVTFRGKTVELR